MEFFYNIDKIYITGGFNGHECLNSAEVYDPDTNQWSMIAPMRSRRSGVSCISYHSHVYVIGNSRNFQLKLLSPAIKFYTLLYFHKSNRL